MSANKKLNNLQVLRAFAAVSVTLFHLPYSFPHMHRFGSFGIDVFFVISGYIMARILDSGSPSSGDFFFRRRLLRIVPPYWFFTLCLFCAAAVAPQVMGATRANPAELIKSLFFIPFVKQDGRTQPLLFLGWTLNVEMFFYVCLAVGQRFTRRHAAWAGSAIVLLVMLGCMPFARYSVLAQFYSMPRIVEFVLGVACYHLCQKVSEDSATRYRYVSLVAFVGSLFLLIYVEGIWYLRGVGEVAALCVASVIAVASGSLLAQGGKDTNLAAVVLVGDASYILYLVHPYCELTIGRIIASRHHLLNLATPSGAFIATTLSIVVALLIHVYAERPTVKFLYSRLGGKRKPLEFTEPVLTPAD